MFYLKILKLITFGFVPLCIYYSITSKNYFNIIFKIFTKVYNSHKRKNKDKFVVTPSDKADKVLTHRVFGIPIFLAILFAIFHLTFSENFLFLSGVLPEDFVTLNTV